MTRLEEKSIRVRVLNRDFGLRVTQESEAVTREIAAYVDAKLRAFQRAHPDQPEITATIITALAIAEELFTTRDEHARALRLLDSELGALDEQLAGVLDPVEDFSLRAEPDTEEQPASPTR